MATTFRLYSPQVIINNDVYEVIPDTFTLTNGAGERTVATVANGVNVSQVISEDLTTKKGKMAFSLPATAVNASALRDIQNNFGSNVIKISDNQSDYTAILTSATLINDPEVQLQQEGNIDFEFEGNPIV